MKKALLIVLAIVICVVGGAVYVGHSAYRAIKDVIASGCVNCFQVDNGGPMIKGSGVIKTETRTVAPFTAIRLEAPANVVIDRTGTPSLSLTTDDNLLEFFTSDVKDGALHLAVARGKSFQAKAAVFHVTVADLRAIEIRGSGDVEANQLDGPALSVSITGSGNARLAGRTDALTLSIKGSGDVDAGGLEAKRVKVVVSGSGDAIVNASDTLDVQLSGSGDVRYLGSPKLTKDVRGSGSLERK